jgi:hypothetical protein
VSPRTFLIVGLSATAFFAGLPFFFHRPSAWLLLWVLSSAVFSAMLFIAVYFALRAMHNRLKRN